MSGEQNDLRVTLIQADLFWEDVEANLSYFERVIHSLGGKTDLIVLPEMFATGFSLEPELLAQGMDGTVVEWMRSSSQRLNADIAGSLIVEEDGAYYNRLIWMRPSGRLSWYDKRHLFRYAGEDRAFTQGETTIVIELNGWRIKPFVCYDLRFPIWTRNRGNEYDICLYVANWPVKRSLHWQALLVARAIENQAYVVGVNRVGIDGNGHEYSGDSGVYSPEGHTLYSKSGVADSTTISLSYSALKEYRQKFPTWMDADVDGEGVVPCRLE